MSQALGVAFLVFACTVPVYLHAFYRLYGIVKAEKPEWIQVRGSLSFFYDGLSRAGDPNVQVEILRIAFGPRARELQAPMAASYVKRIRILLPIGLVLFALVLAGAIVGAP